MKPVSHYEDLMVTHLEEARTSGLLQALAGFQIEVLGDQVDLEQDQLNSMVAHILVASNRIQHGKGFAGRDPLSLLVVALVPGGLQRERRQQAVDALCAIADWMRTDELAKCTYLPADTVFQRAHPLAIATLTVSRVG